MMQHDELYRKFIQSNSWRKLRREKLTQNPICERCEENGKVTPANEVHHITPVESVHQSEQETMMFAFSNLMSLCSQCHRDIHWELDKRPRVKAHEREMKLAKQSIKRFFGGEDEDV